MSEIRPASITHARVLHIAVPVVLANVTVPILGAVDTGVVGQLGEAAHQDLTRVDAVAAQLILET